jgi:hypothetical protein
MSGNDPAMIIAGASAADSLVRKVETSESGKGSENVGSVLFRGQGRKPYRFLRAANGRACRLRRAPGCMGSEHRGPRGQSRLIWLLPRPTKWSSESRRTADGALRT